MGLRGRAGTEAGPEVGTEAEAASQQRFGVQTLVSLAVGGTVGSGWLFGATGVQRAAGVGSLLSWVLGGVFMVATAVVLVELGGRWRENGGLVFWPSQACGPLLTTMVAATLWFFYALNPASESVALLFGDKDRLTSTDQLAALLLMVPIIAVNLCALRLVLRITLILAVFKIVVPVVVVAALLVWHFDVSALTQVPRESGGNGFSSALTAITASGVVYAYIGFQGPLDFAGQVRTAGRGESWRLRWAVLGTVAGTSVVYVLLQLVYLGHRGWTGAGAGSPFIGLVDGVPVIGGGLRYCLDIAERIFPAGSGIVFALLLTREIEQLSMSRFTDARLIESRSLPSRFFRGREVLWRILSVNLVIGATSLIVLGARWQQLSAASGTLALLIYAMPAVCLGTLARVDRTIARWLRLLCGFCFTATTVIIFWSDPDVLLRVALIVGVGTALLLVLPSDLVRHRKLIGGYRAASHLRRIREHRSDPHVKAALVYAGYICALVLLSGIGPSSRWRWIGDRPGIVIAAAVGVVSYGLLVRYSAEHLARSRSTGSAAVTGSAGSTSS
ncbi:MAG: APC family permease [Catenulispora sp.]